MRISVHQDIPLFFQEPVDGIGKIPGDSFHETVTDVLVRDDFWLAANRFMQDLEVRLVEGENSGLVDLSDPLHARKVLATFRRAYDRLPDDTVELSPEQNSFLDRAVDGLAQDRKIICVRLALFADMLKRTGQTTTHQSAL